MGPEPEKMERPEELINHQGCKNKVSELEAELQKMGFGYAYLVNANAMQDRLIQELKEEINRSKEDQVEIEFTENDTAELFITQQKTIARLTEENEKLKSEKGSFLFSIEAWNEQHKKDLATINDYREENKKQRARIDGLEKENMRLIEGGSACDKCASLVQIKAQNMRYRQKINELEETKCGDCQMEYATELKLKGNFEARISAIEEYFVEAKKTCDFVKNFKPGGEKCVPVEK